MSFAAVAIGAGTIGGSLIAADASKKAAKKQANAINNASGISAAAAEQARRDVLNQFSPSMIEFVTGIQQAKADIARGQIDSTAILNQTTEQANDLIAASTNNIQRTILGQPPLPIDTPQQVEQSAQQTTQQGSVAPQTTQTFGPTGEVSGPTEIRRLLSPGLYPPVESIQAAGPETQVGVTARQPDAILPPQGSEQFGALPALAAMREGFGQARTDIQAGAGAAGQALQTGRRDLQTGMQGALASLAAGRTGGLEQLGAGESRALSQLAQAQEAGIGRIDDFTGRSLAEIEQFASIGESAAQREAALSGALGPEAQQAAIESFTESPGQRFLRERAEQALLRSAAATGGLGGGNVRTALQEQAIGIAGTQQQQALENLRSIAGRGQQAATQQAGIQQTGGLTGAQLLQQIASQGAGISQQTGTAGAQLMAGIAGQEAGVQQAGAAGQAQIASQLANLQQQTGMSLAQLAQSSGLTEQQFLQQIGQQLAGVQAAGAGQQVQNLLNLGTARAGITTGGATQLSNLAAQQGQGLTNIRTGTGQTLANIAVGAGSQQAGLAQQVGNVQAAGIMGQNAAIQQGIQGLTGLAGMAMAPTPQATSPFITAQNPLGLTPGQGL